jgi:AraC family transcriptional regulator of adaptative response / DNA-3-methyladenine glycosylase II
MQGVDLDFDTCYEAAASRDRRFDGQFYMGVTSTGIYCRPACPARMPRPANVCFYRTAAGAAAAGFRACLRCRPDLTPGSPEWDVRGDLSGRAMRLIADGVVDRDGVPGLARRLHVGERQLHRVLTAELGASPVALARWQRALTARTLIERSQLAFTEIAAAAGFGSIRQFNDTIREQFGRTPTELRGGGIVVSGGSVATTVALRLAYREPFDMEGILAFLAARALPGVEEVTPDGSYRRTLDLPHGHGVLAAADGGGHLRCTLTLADLRDLPPAIQRVRRLFDLDTDPLAIAHSLEQDRLLRPLVHANPGRRVPGCVHPGELALRTVLGQQVTISAARGLAVQLVGALGEPLSISDPSLSAVFPDVSAVAHADLSALRMPGARKLALAGVSRALAEGEVDLDGGVDRERVRAQLLGLRGIGQWTASYVLMRALGSPDEFLPTDTGVRAGVARLGLANDPASVSATAARWAPWRSYAMHHLWSAPAPTPSREASR